jgi:hypothetical protein
MIRLAREVQSFVALFLLVSAALVSGCASAGGTAGSSDLGSVWYKHPVTGDVKECGGGFYPGVQIRRYNCGKRYLAEGYLEVQKCKEVRAGTPCVTDAERRAAEAAERGEAAEKVARAWVLWRPALDSARAAGAGPVVADPRIRLAPRLRSGTASSYYAFDGLPPRHRGPARAEGEVTDTDTRLWHQLRRSAS